MQTQEKIDCENVAAMVRFILQKDVVSQCRDVADLSAVMQVAFLPRGGKLEEFLAALTTIVHLHREMIRLDRVDREFDAAERQKFQLTGTLTEALRRKIGSQI
jgi:hypothetical protein